MTVRIFYAPDGEGTGTGTTTETPKEKLFTQAEVDSIIGTRLAKEKKTAEELSARLKTVEDLKTITEQERDSIRQEREKIENSFLSEKEQAQKKAAEEGKRYAEELKRLVTERDQAVSLFETSTIERALVDAAAAHKAENTSQIVGLFGRESKLAKDESGNYVVVMDVTIQNDQKQPEKKTLPVQEALRVIKEQGLHSNLFVQEGSNGTGRRGTGATSKSGIPNRSDYSNDQDYAQAYSTYRKKMKE